MQDIVHTLPMALLFKTIMNILDITGVIIIVIGAVGALRRYFLGLLGKAPSLGVDQIRLDLGRTIVLAVEFMLGALVIIRTVLTYFLNQELEQLQHTQ